VSRLIEYLNRPEEKETMDVDTDPVPFIKLPDPEPEDVRAEDVPVS